MIRKFKIHNPIIGKILIAFITIFSTIFYTCTNKKNDELYYLTTEKQKFEKDISSILSKKKCDNLYKCYADTSLKSNAGIVLSDETVRTFEEFKENQIFDSIFILDSNNNLSYPINSIYLKLLKSLSKNNKFYKGYLDIIIEYHEITPTLSSGLNYFISRKNSFSSNEKKFLFLHYFVVYNMSYHVQNYFYGQWAEDEDYSNVFTLFDGGIIKYFEDNSLYHYYINNNNLIIKEEGHLITTYRILKITNDSLELRSENGNVLKLVKRKI